MKVLTSNNMITNEHESAHVKQYDHERQIFLIFQKDDVECLANKCAKLQFSIIYFDYCDPVELISEIFACLFIKAWAA